MNLFIWWFFTVGLSHAWAVCPEIDLYKSNPEIFDQLSIVDQRDSSICYAHVASDLINFHLMSKKNESDPVLHPYWLAYKHKEKKLLHWAANRLDYSAILWAVSDYKKMSNCRYDQLHNHLQLLLKNKNLEESDLFVFYEYYHQYLLSRKSSQMNFRDYLLKKLKKSPPYWLPKWEVENIYEIAQSLPEIAWRKKRFAFYRDHIFSECQSEAPTSQYQLPKFNSYFSQQENQLKRILDVQKAPAAIGYCSNLFEQTSYTMNFNCSPHYSSIVAVRKGQYQCEYLLRNSYGRDYWTKTAFFCACKMKGASVAEHYDCDKKSFDEDKEEVLGCWIPAKNLINSTFEVSGFN